MTSTLAHMFPLEQARLRELLDAYREVGAAGTFGYLAISNVLQRADKAAAEGDTVAMLRLYEEMRGCQ